MRTRWRGWLQIPAAAAGPNGATGRSWKLLVFLGPLRLRSSWDWMSPALDLKDRIGAGARKGKSRVSFRSRGAPQRRRSGLAQERAALGEEQERPVSFGPLGRVWGRGRCRCAWPPYWARRQGAWCTCHPHLFRHSSLRTCWSQWRVARSAGTAGSCRHSRTTQNLHPS